MSGRWWLIAAGFCAGVMLMVGYWWAALPVLIYVGWIGRNLVRGGLLVAISLGALVGWHEAKQRVKPPLPQGAVLVMPTDWTIQATFVRYVGTAANGVRVSGSANVTPDVAQALASLTTPAIVTWSKTPARLPGARNEYEFDYADYAWAQNHQAYQIPTQKLQWQAVAPATLSQWLDSLRAKLMQRLERLPPLTSRYAKGLLLGQVDADFDDLRATFVNLGIFHLFSVSGLHLFALIGLLYWLTDRLRVPKEAVDWGVIGLLPALLILIPPGAGILRAVWMRVGMSLNARLKLDLTGFDVFALVLMGNVWYRPLVLTTFGGQLTYLLCGVLLVVPAMPNWQIAWRMVATGTPVVLAHTFQFHLLSGWFNWLLMPVFEVVIMPLLAVVVLMPQTPLTNWCEQLLTLGEYGLGQLAKLPGLVIFGAVTPWLAALGVVVVLAALAHQRLRYAFMWLIGAYALANWHPQARVVMFDVGQGDAILVEAPFKQGVMLIDTGGRLFGTSRNPPALRVIVNYLHARGYAKLDTLVLTHADADHVGDAAVVTKALPVNTVVSTPLAANHPLIQATVHGQVSRHQQALAGAVVRAGSLQFTVVAPSAMTATEKNADSLVLYGRIGEDRWLFTGDADASVERNELIPKHLAVDYLKVAHHGSNTATSPELIAQWQLKAALISAGVNNRYGHPHLATLTTLAKAQVPTYVTANSGQLTVEHGQITEFLKDKMHASQ